MRTAMRTILSICVLVAMLVLVGNLYGFDDKKLPHPKMSSNCCCVGQACNNDCANFSCSQLASVKRSSADTCFSGSCGTYQTVRERKRFRLFSSRHR